MRISDWSSDVCSSDLQAVMLLARRQPHRLIAQADHGGLVGDLLAVEPCAAALDQAPGFTLRGRKTERDQRVDDPDLPAGDRMARQRVAGRPFLARNSVGWGTRGAVRVDLGCRRLIKKKK